MQEEDEEAEEVEELELGFLDGASSRRHTSARGMGLGASARGMGIGVAGT